jgi:hypothetical protein
MKHFYDARSKIVHGDVLKTKQSRAIADVDEARGYVRRLLLAFVGVATSPPAKFDRKFFESELDLALQDERVRRRVIKELGIHR